MSNWFETWFRDDAYLALYGHRDRDEARNCVELIVRTAALLPPSEVLDLASGPGRHAIELALLGFSVTAVDLSPTLLEHSLREAEEEGVSITAIESDMRAISFTEQFDLAVQLFTSFGYFDDADDDDLVLRLVRRSLKPGGWYALDLINTRRLHQKLVAESKRSEDGLDIVERRRIENGRVIKDIDIISPDGVRQSFHESVRLFSPGEIDGMLRRAGFEPTYWFGDYHGTKFNSDSSDRMLILSRTAETPS